MIQIDAPPTVSSFLQRMGRTGRRPGAITNCLFLATSDEALLQAAALLALWREGFVEPVLAPPKPFHIAAQQLMALVLQEHGIGQRAWFEWISEVPAFAAIEPGQLAGLVDHLITTRILWSDNGLMSFGPEGEARYGRRNFMDLLSVFTSPPLFKVLNGQKELGNVHESTFYNQQEGPAVLVLAGRSWRTQHLDWKRRIAHVEPSEERGRSRWLGEGQFLSFQVCQSIRRVLGGDEAETYWSQRAKAQINQLRDDHPWVDGEATSIVRQQSGEIHWWTFGGGTVNTLLKEHLRAPTGIRSDNLAIRFPATCTMEDIEGQIAALTAEAVVPAPNEDAIENLKFGECLPPPIAAEVFCARFNAPEAIRSVLHERRQVTIYE